MQNPTDLLCTDTPYLPLTFFLSCSKSGGYFYHLLMPFKILPNGQKYKSCPAALNYAVFLHNKGGGDGKDEQIGLCECQIEVPRWKLHDIAEDRFEMWWAF